MRGVCRNVCLTIDITNMKFQLCVSLATIFHSGSRLVVGVLTLSKCSRWPSTSLLIISCLSGSCIDLSKLARASSTSPIPAVPRVFRKEKIAFPFLTLCAALIIAIRRRSSWYDSRIPGSAQARCTAAILYAKLWTSAIPVLSPKPPVGGKEWAASPALRQRSVPSQNKLRRIMALTGRHCPLDTG